MNVNFNCTYCHEGYLGNPEDHACWQMARDLKNRIADLSRPSLFVWVKEKFMKLKKRGEADNHETARDNNHCRIDRAG